MNNRLTEISAAVLAAVFMILTCVANFVKLVCCRYVRFPCKNDSGGGVTSRQTASTPCQVCRVVMVQLDVMPDVM